MLKIKRLILLVSIIQLFSFITHAQEKPVLNFTAENKTIREIMTIIEKETDYTFLFNSTVDVRPKVTIRADHEPLDNLLARLFDSKEIDFEITGKQIILTKRNQPAISTHQITGLVMDELGEAVIGATVIIKGHNTGTITDVNGTFTLQVPTGNNLLLISFLGYETKEVPINARTQHIKIDLSESVTQIDEVVVIGYGTQKKINLTGAVSVVTSKELEDRPAANMSQLLQGTVPNMNITFSSGRPGGTGAYNIRGVNSISNSSAAPLILIDGMEGDIDRVNPRDVESVSVLKDASAAAVYGARASYGVILVTTKQGQSGKTQVSYGGQFAFSGSTVSTDYETRGYYSAAINDFFYEKYAGTRYTTYTEEDYYQLWIRRNDETEHPDRPWVMIDQRDGKDSYVYYANTDWYNYLYNEKRPTWEHNISINGGSDKIKYLLSGNYYQQQGIFRITPDKFKQYNFRSKVSNQVNKWLEISNNTTYFYSNYNYPGAAGIDNTFNSSVNHALASFVPYNPDGTPVYITSLSTGTIADGYTALLTNNGHRNEDKRYEFRTSFEAVLKPLQGLEIRANYNYIHYNYQTMNRSVNIPYSKYPGEIAYIDTGIGANKLNENQINHWYHTYNIYATYQMNIKSLHNIKLMAGYNYETKKLKDLKMERQGLLTDLLDDFNLAKGDVMNITGGKNEYALLGAFYRVNYDYNDRYLFEASGRYDGSSRFRRGNRFGFFPSFSAGWRVSEEDFFLPVKEWISNFKIRLSYGSLGNQQVGYYDYIQTINTGSLLDYSFGEDSKASYANETAPNATDLTWEKVYNSNIGFELGFLDNRLNVEADLYIRDTKDMLTAGKTLPAVYGANSPQQNAADLRTKGWEISVSWNDRIPLAGKMLHYNLMFGLGDYTSKVTRFDNPTKELSDFYEGQKLGEIWGYIVDGYFLSDDEAANYHVDQTSVNTIINTSAQDQGLRAGDLKFVDLDGDNKISTGANTADNPGDRKVIGNSLPRYTYSANLGAQWNGIDFSIFFQGIGRQHWYPDANAIGFWGPYARPYSTFITSDFLSKVWSEDNPDAYFPRPRGYIALSNTNRSLGVPSNKYLQNLAYCRIKNITVGYSLPNNLLSKIKLEKVRFYFSGENLFTFTKLESDYIDPEQAATKNTYKVGTNTAKVYPWYKTYSFGIDITF